MWRLLSSKILKTNNEKGFEVLSVKLYFQCKKLAGIEHVAAGGGFTTANSGKGLSRAIPGIQADPFGSFFLAIIPCCLSTLLRSILFFVFSPFPWSITEHFPCVIRKFSPSMTALWSLETNGHCWSPCMLLNVILQR